MKLREVETAQPETVNDIVRALDLEELWVHNIRHQTITDFRRTEQAYIHQTSEEACASSSC
ncbi:Hypothetical protein FKW44_009327, partial [Caligus rogercresseyi]